MEWSRSDTLGLASASCVKCFGLGLKPGRGKSEVPCGCVLRAIFRACHNRFRECAAQDGRISRPTLDMTSRKLARVTWGRKDEEFMADFLLVAKRTLTPAEHQLFRFHFLLGADWRLCTRKLKTDRGTFFHAVYRIEEKLGRTFRELEPYSLFPLDEYFGSTGRATAGNPKVVEMKTRLNRLSRQVPLKKTA